MRHERTMEELRSRQDEIMKMIGARLEYEMSQVTKSLQILADHFEEATKSKDGMISDEFLIDYTLGMKVAETDWRNILDLSEDCTWREVVCRNASSILKIVDTSLAHANEAAEAMKQAKETPDEENRGETAEVSASFHLNLLCTAVAVAFSGCAAYSSAEDSISLLLRLCHRVEYEHSDESVRRWALRQSEQLQKDLDFVFEIRQVAFEKLLLVTEYPRHSIVRAITDVRVKDMEKWCEFETIFLQKGLEYFENPKVIDKIRAYEKEVKNNA